MRNRTIFAAALLTASLLAGCATVQTAPATEAPVHTPPPNHGHVAQPYAGLQDREIKALAPERIADLLEGKGIGYALSAELNHFPGPQHVVDMAQEMKLAAHQEERVRSLIGPHKERAKALGQELVNLERQLDVQFRSGQITEAELDRLLSAIGKVESDLRAEHLRTHLQTKALLTAEQVALYDELRGYSK